ncbi:PTS-dependent dihydroxyacetone kinase phosphotransferase subunit DhaM [Halobium salinum]|uniref:PTS-dependent dihydroxyacetone kinase phosphotransferase subunit DhaM n=1 Tax=Halobium salinum TaxID=1364940 RepID=A0ABD5PDA5_9EURY|nr:PTS mannose transporter subunit IID [Halobium salinum]
MVGLVVVTHSAKVAEGVADTAAQMGGEGRVVPAGGDPDGGLGTDVDRIEAAIRESYEANVDADAESEADGVVVLVDLGSAVMSAETAADVVEVDGIEVAFADAPVVEGTVEAAVEATSPKATLDSVVERAEGAREYRKFG